MFSESLFKLDPTFRCNVQKGLKTFFNDDDKLKYAMDFLDKEANRLVHEKVMKEDKRVDGRGLDEVRKITSEVSILPRTHGTGLFTRGRTRALSILTLGSPGDHEEEYVVTRIGSSQRNPKQIIVSNMRFATRVMVKMMKKHGVASKDFLNNKQCIEQ